MDLWSVIKTVLRRWYIALPLTVATVFGVVSVPQFVKPSYKAYGTALLAVPSFDLEALKQQRREKLNPFLSFNPSLNISAVAISRILEDDGVRTRVESLGLDPRFVIYFEQDIPAVTVISVDDSPSVSIRTVRYLLDQTAITMTQLQKSADVPPEQFIRVGTISYSKKAEVITAKVNRARIGLGAFGLALAAGAALGFDALVTYSRNSRARGDAGGGAVGRSSRRRRRSRRRKTTRPVLPATVAPPSVPSASSVPSAGSGPSATRPDAPANGRPPRAREPDDLERVVRTEAATTSVEQRRFGSADEAMRERLRPEEPYESISSRP